MGAVCFAYERGALLQALNSYSYANDNPITKSDPAGRSALTGGFGFTAFNFTGGFPKAEEAPRDAKPLRFSIKN
jgi:hypothetical protein